MSDERRQFQEERENRLRLMETAARDAVRAALRRHMLLGESVVVADEHGKVKTLTPEEIRQALDAA